MAEEEEEEGNFPLIEPAVQLRCRRLKSTYVSRSTLSVSHMYPSHDLCTMADIWSDLRASIRARDPKILQLSTNQKFGGEYEDSHQNFVAFASPISKTPPSNWEFQISFHKLCYLWCIQYHGHAILSLNRCAPDKCHSWRQIRDPQLNDEGCPKGY